MDDPVGRFDPWGLSWDEKKAAAIKKLSIQLNKQAGIKPTDERSQARQIAAEAFPQYWGTREEIEQWRKRSLAAARKEIGGFANGYVWGISRIANKRAKGVGIANKLLGTDLLPDLEKATKEKGWGK